MTGKYANYFLLAAVIYLVASAVLGLAMMLSWTGGEWRGLEYYLIPSHAHLMLLGWVSMTMYGMMYRVVPAFFGRRLYSERLAWSHLVIANIATAGMALFFGLNRWQGGRWVWALAASGGLQFLGVLIFAFNMIASVVSGETKLEAYRDPASKGS
ncbi:MAG: hypothetical protein HY552_02490 [Elusimicrobia bacterium]|nr:hypothetical protein [Elusimicrobiota bacterium]